MPNEAPYKIKKQGDMFAVLNNAGITKKSFKTRDEATAYLRALYANVPGAAKKADKTKWTGKAPKPTKSDGKISMSDGGYPIGSQSDADDAWKLRRHSKNHSEDEVKAHISRAVHKLGLKHPAAREKSNLGFILPADTLARLRERYGPREESAKEPKPAPAADAEKEIIKKNKLHPMADKPHPFHKSSKPIDGAHRCLMCGQTQPDNPSGQCNVTDVNGTLTPRLPQRPSFPIAAGEVTGLGLQTYTVNTTNAFNGQTSAYSVTSLSERVPPPALTQPNWAPDHPAFVTELNGKTLVTAQATVDPALFERAFTPNEYFLWTQGRLVGADEANRNGAFWTSGDLELGQATVKHGPLNWLHDGKHVIGTLAEAAFTTPSKEQADDTGFTQPHIAVVGPVWRWIYPDEAEVIQMASEANKFWYSMECISKTVQCVGDGSCGAEAAYLDYIQGKGKTCQHMIQRSATRRFADPTFLGAAVIVPPVRPGWTEANAGVMTKAAEIAEKSFDRAGRPDVSASEWEQLMAQIVRFAGVS